MKFHFLDVCCFMCLSIGFSVIIFIFVRGTDNKTSFDAFIYKSQFIFLELLRAGLWDTEADLSWLRGTGTGRK